MLTVERIAYPQASLMTDLGMTFVEILSIGV